MERCGDEDLDRPMTADERKERGLLLVSDIRKVMTLAKGSHRPMLQYTKLFQEGVVDYFESDIGAQDTLDLGDGGTQRLVRGYYHAAAHWTACYTRYMRGMDKIYPMMTQQEAGLCQVTLEISELHHSL